MITTRDVTDADWEWVSTIGRRGIGSVLLDEVEARAKAAGASQVRLSATNDNFPALRFCQLRGYTLRQLIPNRIWERITPSLCA